MEIDELIEMLKEAKKMNDMKQHIRYLLENALFDEDYFMKEEFSLEKKAKWMNEVKDRLKDLL